MKEEAGLLAGICVIVLYLCGVWWLNDIPTMRPLGEFVSEYSIFGIWKRQLSGTPRHAAPDIPSYSSFITAEEFKRFEDWFHFFQLAYYFLIVIYWTIVDLFLSLFFTEIGYATRPLAIIYLFFIFLRSIPVEF